MPYAVGLDALGTDIPITVDGVPIEGNYIEITWEQYTDGITALINNKHVCVVDDQLVIDYQITEENA